MGAILVFADQVDPLDILFENPVYVGQTIEMDFQIYDKDPAEGGVAQDLSGTRWTVYVQRVGSSETAMWLDTHDNDADAIMEIDEPSKTTKLRITPDMSNDLAAGKYIFQVWVEFDDNPDRRFMFATGKIPLKAPIDEMTFI